MAAKRGNLKKDGAEQFISSFFVLAFVALQAERKRTIEQLETRVQALQEEVS